MELIDFKKRERRKIQGWAAFLRPLGFFPTEDFPYHLS
jgi:hypothetical protein